VHRCVGVFRMARWYSNNILVVVAYFHDSTHFSGLHVTIPAYCSFNGVVFFLKENFLYTLSQDVTVDKMFSSAIWTIKSFSVCPDLGVVGFE